MKFTIDLESFKQTIGIISRTSPNRPAISVLACTKIEVKDNTLTMTTTDLERAVVATAQVRVEEDGECLVLTKTLHDLISQINNDKVKVSLIDKELKVFSNNLETAMSVVDVEQFPKVPELDDKANSFEIDSESLKTALLKTQFCASIDQARPVLSGVYFNFENDSTRIVATDSFRLAEYRIKNKNRSSINFILPIAAAIELQRILGALNSGTIVKLKASDSQVEFYFSNTKLISKLIYGKFPNYLEIIPTNISQRIAIDKQELLQSLRAAEIFSRSNGNIVKLKFENKSLNIHSQAAGVGNYENVIELEESVENSLESSLNIRYLTDCINAVDGEIVFCFSQDSAKTLVVQGSLENDNYRHLIMPLRSSS